MFTDAAPRAHDGLAGSDNGETATCGAIEAVAINANLYGLPRKVIIAIWQRLHFFVGNRRVFCFG